MEPTRPILAGDIHGDLHHVKWLFEIAETYDADSIIALGDFGYWEHQKSGIYFLDYIESKVASSNNPIKAFYFIDGNHENHTLLRRRYMGKVDLGRDVNSVQDQLVEIQERKGPWRITETKEGFFAVRKGVYYIPRSAIWSWSGVRFAALGGAYSIDINRRRSGTSWWPEEMITPDEVDAFYQKNKVDVFLSHDVPLEVDMNKQFATRGEHWIKADPNTIRNRTLLSKAVDFVNPDYLFHGHYHLAYTDVVHLQNGHELRVQGLGMNGMGNQSFTILDLKEHSVNQR